MHQIKREQLSRKGLIFQALKVTNAVNRDDGKVSAGAINIDQDYSTGCTMPNFLLWLGKNNFIVAIKLDDHMLHFNTGHTGI